MKAAVMIRISVLLMALASASFTAPSVFAQTCEEVLYVGAWNIQWLGNPKEGKRPAQVSADVASYIAAGGVSVLSLAEISATSTSGGKNTNKTLDEAFAQLNTTGAKWTYRLFEKRAGARAPADQWTGLAWDDSRVSLVGGPWKLDVAIDEPRENKIRAQFDKPEKETIILSRWPYAAKFSTGAGKTDFVVVPIHLKSNIGGAATAQARAYEVELIMQGLAKLKQQHSDEDLMVLGDSNMLTAGEAAGLGLQSAGLKDCNARDLGTHISFVKGQKWAPFDRIFLMSSQPETAASCSAQGNGSGRLDFKIIQPQDWKPGVTPSQFVKALSDHMMVRAGICVQKDDD
jgi:predicted extracellular nuclease